jgi:hypothetical protein
MRRFALRRSIHAVLITAVAMTAAWPASAADTITVGSVTATGNTVQVPVYLRVARGSPLGSDTGAGNRIQFLSFEVEYPPTSGFSSFVTLERTGVLQGLTAMIEDTMSILGKIRYSGVFNESTQPIPFTLNAAPPGNEIAMLTFTLNEFATPNSTIPLTLNPAETFLKNQFGSVLETPGPDHHAAAGRADDSQGHFERRHCQDLVRDADQQANHTHLIESWNRPGPRRRRNSARLQLRDLQRERN